MFKALNPTANQAKHRFVVEVGIEYTSTQARYGAMRVAEGGLQLHAIDRGKGELIIARVPYGTKLNYEIKAALSIVFANPTEVRGHVTVDVLRQYLAKINLLVCNVRSKIDG